MDVKDIRAFMGCYETRSINKAAKSLYISPQGLGKILDRIEQELEVSLFERTKQGLVPTEAGVFFYEKSMKLIEETQELEQGLEKIRRKNDVFNVGYSCGAIHVISMKRLENLRKSLGSTHMVLEEGSNPDIKEKIINGQFDVALVIGRIAAKGFVEKELAIKKMCAIIPKGHKLFDKDIIRIEELKEEKLITLNEQYQSFSNLVKSCERQSFYPNIRVKTMEASMIYEFVREGLGVGISVDINDRYNTSEDYKVVPIENGIPWVVYIVYSKDKVHDPYIKMFVDAIK